MVLAVARLTAQTRVLSQPVARLALVRFRLQHLAGRLVLELIVLAQEVVAEAALVHAATVIPNATFTFDANGIHQRTDAGMRLKALAPVADPGLTVVTDGPNHLQSGGVHSRMLHDAISGL